MLSALGAKKYSKAPTTEIPPTQKEIFCTLSIDDIVAKIHRRITMAIANHILTGYFGNGVSIFGNGGETTSTCEVN